MSACESIRLQRQRNIPGLGRTQMPGRGYLIEEVARFLGKHPNDVRSVVTRLGLARRLPGETVRLAPLTDRQVKRVIQRCRARQGRT